MSDRSVQAHEDGLAALVPPSCWVQRWLHDLPAASRIVDVAAGSGRHARLAASQGHRVLAVDRDGPALARLASLDAHIATLRADLESGPWPLAPGAFDAVIVTNYLFRSRFALLCGLLAPGGRLVYETFAQGNQAFGRPSNPAFLLRDGELLDRCAAAGLVIVAYETGVRRQPGPAVVQRVCALRPARRPAAASSAKLEVLPTELPNLPS